MDPLKSKREFFNPNIQQIKKEGEEDNINESTSKVNDISEIIPNQDMANTSSPISHNFTKIPQTAPLNNQEGDSASRVNNYMFQKQDSESGYTAEKQSLTANPQSGQEVETAASLQSAPDLFQQTESSSSTSDTPPPGSFLKRAGTTLEQETTKRRKKNQSNNENTEKLLEEIVTRESTYRDLAQSLLKHFNGNSEEALEYLSNLLEYRGQDYPESRLENRIQLVIDCLDNISPNSLEEFTLNFNRLSEEKLADLFIEKLLEERIPRESTYKDLAQSLLKHFNGNSKEALEYLHKLLEYRGQNYLESRLENRIQLVIDCLDNINPNSSEEFTLNFNRLSEEILADLFIEKFLEERIPRESTYKDLAQSLLKHFNGNSKEALEYLHKLLRHQDLEYRIASVQEALEQICSMPNNSMDVVEPPQITESSQSSNPQVPLASPAQQIPLATKEQLFKRFKEIITSESNKTSQKVKTLAKKSNSLASLKNKLINGEKLIELIELIESLNKEQADIFYKILKFQPDETSIFRINEFCKLVKETKLESAELVVFCLENKFDIKNVEKISIQEAYIKPFIDICKIINKTGLENNEILKLSFEILENITPLIIENEEKLLPFFLSIIELDRPEIIIPAIQLVKKEDIYKYYLGLNSGVERKICRDYIIWKADKTKKNELIMFTRTAMEKYQDNTVNQYIDSEVFNKHLRDDKKTADEQAVRRRKSSSAISYSSVLAAPKPVFLQGFALTLQANSVMIERFLKDEIELNGGNYIPYSFSPDDPFFATAEAYKCYFVASPQANRATEYQWTGIEFNLLKNDSKGFRITHGSPMHKGKR